METFDAVIAGLGGPTVVAGLIGVTPQAVTNMRARRSIPAEYWPRLVRAALEKGIDGVTFEGLARIAATRRSDPSLSDRESAQVLE